MLRQPHESCYTDCFLKLLNCHKTVTNSLKVDHNTITIMLFIIFVSFPQCRRVCTWCMLCIDIGTCLHTNDNCANYQSGKLSFRVHTYMIYFFLYSCTKKMKEEKEEIRQNCVIDTKDVFQFFRLPIWHCNNFTVTFSFMLMMGSC